MKKIILIGPINKNKLACTGDTVKNQLFLKRFNEVFDKVINVDTYQWKKRPWCLIEMLVKVVFNRGTKIVVSANPGSADKIIRILIILGYADNVYYWVVGGSFHTMLSENRFSLSVYNKIKGIFVQGKSMVSSLYHMGISNAIFVPNSKYIEFLPQKKFHNAGKTHFVFLSRIEKEKGCDMIIDAFNILIKQGYKDKFDITFYGKTTVDLGYRKTFEKKIENQDHITYKGVLDLRVPSNYNELAEYDVMLFPTYWEGEGFPGVIIDAYIAGLPVIASDWNLNSDVVIDNETGWIIPTHDTNELAKRMIFAIEYPETIKQFSENSMKLALSYDSRTVLSVNNLEKIGLI